MLYHIHFSVVSRVVCMSLLRIYYTVSCLCCSFLYILTATMTIISLRMHCASVTAVHAYAPLSWRSPPRTSTVRPPSPCSSTATIMPVIPRTSTATIVACMYGVIEVASCRRWGISASERRYKCRSG